MHSIELHFSEEMGEFLGYQKQYSRLFRKMYSNLELMDDPTFKKECLAKNPLLDVMAWDSAKIQIKMKRAQMETFKKKQIELQAHYIKERDALTGASKRTKFKYYKLSKKLKHIEHTLNEDSDIVFGGKGLLRQITYNKNMHTLTGNQDYLDAYSKHLIEYRQKRTLPFYVVGKSAEGGNRKFDFDFINGKILFKADRKNHFDIPIKTGNKQVKILCKLQEMLDRNEIAITVSLTTKKIILTYDNELLNGYHFHDKKCKATQASVPAEQRKDVWISYKKEQEARKLNGKMKTRFAAIDMNPDKIGFCIMDAGRIILKKCYHLKKVIKKVKGNNTKEIEFNLSHIYKSIFKYCKHFKVSAFVTEDLEFKHDETTGKEFNRNTKNLWCRTHQTMLINKYTQNLGIRHIQVNPAYSSFIGNLLFGLYDPISASAEICRRGLVLTKTIIDDWYPKINRLHLDSLNLETHVPDLVLGDLTIRSLFNLVSSLNLRYRHVSKQHVTSELIKCYIS